jgi:2-polyprenyl-3-methyl-5-hydroxy-6-metoxy-1,4-benzoquinol methylase
MNNYQGLDKKYFEERIEYFVGSVDNFIEKNENKEADVITAMEVIEHVNYPMDFLSAINKLLKNDGILFLSTINKNYLSYLSTIIGKNHFISSR